MPNPSPHSGPSISAKDETPPEEAPPNCPFPIVGVGASAGGLDAFTRFLQHLPEDTGMAFVLVQHLAPDHESILADLLSKATKMPVQEAREGLPVTPNRVYVIPPEKDITILGGVLSLHPRTTTSHGTHMPVDLFFRSLAEIQGAKAIGVVLSGNGSDGALGVEEIHSKGGLTLSQDPLSAQFDGMPRSAVSTGCVNFVLSPEQIGEELGRIGRHPYLIGRVPLPDKTDEAPSEGGDDLAKVFRLLRVKTGVDFSLYKRATINRRILRRMVLQKIGSFPDYIARLESDPAEVDALYHDILIKVTRFFRDPKIFEILKTKIFGEIAREKSSGAPIRLWVPGCSTGEEVYSLAICLLEFLGDRDSHIPIQIFGSDISERSLEKARAAVYIENIAADVSPERLRRFFNKTSGGYQVNKSVRDLCVFAKQNIVRDPPFSKLDLVSCRNVLIYMNPVLQKKVFPIFHFALNPKGWLLLGSSETVGSSSDYFSVVDRNHRIFAKNAGVSPRLNFDFAVSPAAGERLEKKPMPSLAADFLSGRTNFQKEADRTLLNRYAPVGVVVDDNLDIVQFRGDTTPYFQNPAGEPSVRLLKVAREGLQSELNAAFKEVRSTNAPFRKGGLHVEFDGRTRNVSLEVIPIPLPLSKERYWGVMVEEEGASRLSQAARPAPKRASKKGLREDDDRWKKELASTKTYLESMIEEKEAAFEELQSANEEALSSNEELQSINEEMQTAKEELQSTNEELTTINDELQHSNTRSLQLANDLNNLLESVRIPLVMVGIDLRIRRFTPPAEKMLHLRPGDVGRPIGDINTRIKIVDFEKLLLDAVENVVVKEEQVQDEDGRWYTMRIHPYKTADKRIDGAVIVFLDVETMKQTEISVTKALGATENILATLREPFLVLDAGLKVKRASASFYKTFRVSPGETEGRPVYELGNGEWNIPHLRTLLEEIIPRSHSIRDFEIEHEFRSIGRRTLLLNASRISHKEQEEEFILLAMEDVTESKRAAEELARKAQDLSRSNRDLEDFAHIVSHDLQTPLKKIIAFGDLLKMEIHPALSEKGAESLDRIQNNAQKMGHLIEGLLNFSKISSSSPKLEPVDMSAVARETLADFEGAIKEKGAKVTVAELPTIQAIPVQMIQLITNLVDNAIKYGGNGTPVIELTAEREGSLWYFAVRDNGVGIDPKDAGRIFDLFQRGRTEGAPGNGIGLTLCRRIVENHGGRLWVESEPGKGSTFRFTLPVK